MPLADGRFFNNKAQPYHLPTGPSVAGPTPTGADVVQVHESPAGAMAASSWAREPGPDRHGRGRLPAAAVVVAACAGRSASGARDADGDRVKKVVDDADVQQADHEQSHRQHGYGKYCQ